MTSICVNGIDLAYEEYGSPAGPALLMIHGLGMPQSAWPPAMIDALAALGFRVIAPDNRDIGRSSVLDDEPVPNVAWQAVRRQLGFAVRAPYALDDMMRDHLALLDALAIDRLHVVGISMGGMIAQLLAIAAPERVRSLTSIMSTTGNPQLPGPERDVMRMIRRRPRGRGVAAVREYQRRLWRRIGSPAYPRSSEEIERFLDRINARGITDDGVQRQTLAIISSPSRVEPLSRLSVPTLVIHGHDDPLVPVAAGVDTARSIPDSRMVVIDGMGHDLPDALQPRLTRLIGDHVASVRHRTPAPLAKAG